jgi:hypothetical protein
VAYGVCGLSREEFRHYTPAEFDVLYQARCKARDEPLFALDSMNAVLCMVVARCAGNKNANTADFMTLRQATNENDAVPAMGDSPATIQRKLELMAISMRER